MNDCEKVEITVRDDEGRLLQGKLFYRDVIREGEDLCYVCLQLGNKTYECTEKNYFTVLQRIRKELEKEKLQILCNGAARNVYPSFMMIDMGASMLGYKLYMHQHAKLSDIVNIFDCDNSLDFVTVDEQEVYYEEWVKCAKK